MKTLDDIIKLAYLESPEEGMTSIELMGLDFEGQSKIDNDKKAKLIERLSQSAQEQKTFGKLFKEKLMAAQMDLDDLSTTIKVSLDKLEMLLQDRVYVNRIPIKLFMKLTHTLGITIKEVEEGVWNTFSLLKEEARSESGFVSGVTFRKSSSTSRKHVSTSSSVNEENLIETEHATQKYLNRLQELDGDG